MLAFHACMPAGQREAGAVVIKIYVVPTGGIMAERTIVTVLAAVGILLLVTGIAVCRRTLENFVDMTGLAGNLLVLAFQFE